MDSSVSALLGAAIGAAGTVLGQRQSTRAAERRDRLARAEERRAELQQALTAYSEIYQKMEHGAEGVVDPRESSDRLWTARSHLVWIAPPLRASLDPLTDTLNGLYWHGTPDGEPAYTHLKGLNAEFQEEAGSALRAIEAHASDRGASWRSRILSLLAKAGQRLRRAEPSS
jgi:hypothetical protein